MLFIKSLLNIVMILYTLPDPTSTVLHFCFNNIKYEFTTKTKRPYQLRIKGKMDFPTANHSQTPCVPWAFHSGHCVSAKRHGSSRHPLPISEHLYLGSPVSDPYYHHSTLASIYILFLTWLVWISFLVITIQSGNKRKASMPQYI